MTDQIIIALDTPEIDLAANYVRQIGDAASFYKIGHQLMPIGGFEFGQKLRAGAFGSPKKIFWDFKLLDIGATVEKGTASIAKIGGDMLTIHADADALRGAVQGRGGDSDLQIMAVTVLTSWDQATIDSHGIQMHVADLVLHRAEIAAENGADGVIASAQEAVAIKARFDDELKVVTPGIRPTWAAANDQKRVTTPQDAINAGADHLVIGRPITAAENPSAAFASIADELV